ncbi:hypothetical protein H5410_048897 [Solanum commersonii]|uniref:TIR domain-containing protein n=1 Tax=Solanum commersonii TaxID=4109 RepID=A0A9J5XLV6_SOLCO|nr:hypothetical protein H5410_048897 [Solanum commersonii]
MNTQFVVGESSSSSFLSYDVFLSFRGEDTRKTFIVGVHTFIDDEELRKGDVISIELEKAIEQSRVVIVVFSKNYASSSWCLDELVKILDCKERLNQIILRIFYDVDPTQVRRQTGSFGEALAKHKERLVGAERMEKWKAALTEAANLSGWDLRNVADGLTAHYPIGLDSPIKHIEVLLQSGCEHEVRMVGICGVGGIGKTTLAKAIYNRIFQQFDGSCILSDIRSKTEESGLVKLQEKLRNQIVKTKEFEVDSVAKGVNLIKARLGSKKVLIVLDDVDHRSQLESLTRERSWFGSSSVIIITTRDEHLQYGLTTNEIYRAKLLNDNEAQQLFSCHAFNCFSPPQEYVELAQDIIKYSGGLPLALVTLGSHLQGRSVKEWRYKFKTLKAIPHGDIQKILKISFDGLDVNTQTVFLDIACAFHGWHEDEVTKTLNACGFYCESAIATLVKRHLLQRDQRRLVMHDLVRDMGREIVRMESPRDCGKRSRLVNPQEVLDGSENVEILVVERHALKGVKLNTEAFQKMINLRVLKIDDLHISGDFELLSKELRWLSWKVCPLKCIPSNFPSEKFVFLNMKGSNIQEFCLNLQYCRNLKKLDLSDCKRLRTLWLENCSSLKEIHTSIGNLDRLTDLQLNGCKKITDLPSSICQLKSLTILDINNCSSLQTLPGDIGDMQSLRFLNARETGIKELPGSVEMLNNLIELQVGGRNLEAKRSFSQTRVRPIVSLSTFISFLCLPYCGFSEADVPRDIGNFEQLSKELRWLSWKGCPLKCIPSNFPSEKLVFLNMKWSNIQEFGLNLQYCRSLKELNLSDCKHLRKTPNFNSSRSLETLWLENCSSLKEIHPSIGNLDRLTYLQLKLVDIGDMQSLRLLRARHTGIKQLPGSVEILRNLTRLDVRGRNLEAKRRFSQTRVRSIVSLSKYISILRLSYCGFDVPRDIGKLSMLLCLDLSGNSFLYLPFDFSKLPLLMSLCLNDCENLQTLPSISNLEYLTTLELRNCQKLVEITGLDNLPSIYEIDMINCTSLQNPFSEGFFSAPALENINCMRLESNEIPDWCSNKVKAPSICLTMPTVHNNKFLGMVLWFDCHLGNLTTRLQEFDVTIGQPSAFFRTWVPGSQGEVSCVYYLSFSNGRPFNGLNIIKGGEQIRVEDRTVGAVVKKIGVHLLYLDQNGNVTSFPAVVDHSYTPSYPQRLSAGHINSNNNTCHEVQGISKQSFHGKCVP